MGLAKWLFLGLLAAGVGVLWTNKFARMELIREMHQAREFLNTLTGRYEGWQVVFVSVGVTLILSSIFSFIFKTTTETRYIRWKKGFFRFIRSIPFVNGRVMKELNKAIKDMEKTTFAAKPGETHRLELPKKGLSTEEVINEVSKLESLAKMDWSKGWVSGALYNCSEELTAITTKVYGKFAWVNPLHTDVFPHIRKMEAEVIQWTVKLFNGGKEACGTMTSGGTESILMAMRVYRAIGLERGIEYPEIICAASAHCAFNKAADYFRMKITLVPVDPHTRKVNLRAMARAISSQTVVLVGSAPQFPHGIIDPIEDIARLARKHGIGVHVDCCLGGFLLPFMDKAGFPIDPFDFRVKGVTSISADTHKYGYCPKGTSVVMYSCNELRHRQYFVAPDWQGGVYATAVMAGSRPGALIAAAWACMMHMGEEGYVSATRDIVTTTRKITKSLMKIPGIYVMGSPLVSVIGIGSADFNIYQLNSALSTRGWNLNPLQFPSSIHICLTVLHTKKGVAERFVKDVKECTAEIMKNPKAKLTDQAAMYGMAQALPDRSLVDELAAGYIDYCLKASPNTSD